MTQDRTYGMTAAQEKEFDRKAEQELSGHRGLINGRDFRWNVFRYQRSTREIGERFDETFPHSPDTPGWWDERFCKDCDKRHSMCECPRLGDFDPETAVSLKDINALARL